MKIRFFILFVLFLLTSGGVSAATSTGSTDPCTRGLPCGGGPTISWNYTTARFEMLPQCFPWILASEYFIMDISRMYENQEACRAQRIKDFF